jgi:mannitol/fructose-specific phosphotransferase system IIA component (Ntr-type)
MNQMAETIADLLLLEAVSLDLDARDVGEAIVAVAAPLARNGAVADFGAFCESVLEREKISPTSIGYGIAFPHARTDDVRKIVVAAGRFAQGVDFPGAAEPIRLVFVIGTPLRMVREYLGLLGSLAKALKDPGVRERLLGAASAGEFVEALRP